MDHLFLDGQQILHIMDSTTRFSAESVVPNRPMEYIILVPEEMWMGQFWSLETLVGYQSFNNDPFKLFLAHSGTTF